MDLIIGLMCIVGMSGVWIAWIIWRWWHRKDENEWRAQQIFGTPAPQIIDRLTAQQPEVVQRRGGYPSASVPREQLPRLPESAIAPATPALGLRPAELPAEAVSGRHRIERKAGIEMAQCEQCGDPVMWVRMAVDPDKELCLDPEPDPVKGTVIVFGNPAYCRYLDGDEDWKTVHQYNLPVYVRHRLYCRRFWGAKVFERGDE